MAVLSICASVAAITDHSSQSFNWFGPLVGLAGLAAAIVLIGRFARLFEHQADLSAAERLDDFPLGYLRAVAAISSGEPDQRSWMHPSFDQRCAFLFRGIDAAKRWLRAQLFLGVLATFALVFNLLLLGMLR